MGQNLTTSSTKFVMTRRLLAGDSLAHFNAKAASFKDDDGVAIKIDENLEASLRAVTGIILNKKALSTQKRYMRCIVRKSKDMKIRMYCARFVELN